jgi:hypothetical protein
MIVFKVLNYIISACDLYVVVLFYLIFFYVYIIPRRELTASSLPTDQSVNVFRHIIVVKSSNDAEDIHSLHVKHVEFCQCKTDGIYIYVWA